MSHLDSSSSFGHHNFTCELSPVRRRDPLQRHEYEGPFAIDSALRNVPLPDGLMTRLGMLVYTMSDEAADQVDYLGC